MKEDDNQDLYEEVLLHRKEKSRLIWLMDCILILKFKLELKYNLTNRKNFRVRNVENSRRIYFFAILET